jgi:hypothetical protein
MVLWLRWQEKGENKGEDEETPQASAEVIISFWRTVQFCDSFRKKNTLKGNLVWHYYLFRYWWGRIPV